MSRGPGNDRAPGPRGEQGGGHGGHRRSGGTRPPSWAEWLARIWIPEPDRAPALGDLREEYALRVRQSRLSILNGGLWYVRQAVGVGLRLRLAGATDGAGACGDVRYALRQIKRHPSHATIVMLAVALGIGLNTLILGLARAVFVDPLPYPEGDRLGIVSSAHVGSSTDGFGISWPNAQDLVSASRTIDRLALYLDWQSVNLTGTESAHRVPANFVEPDYLELLGRRARLGRLLTDEDYASGGWQPVAVLTRGTWERLFGADPDVLGRRVLLNGHPFEIVGVTEGTQGDLRQRYQDGTDVGIYLPLGALSTVLGMQVREDRSARTLNGLVLLRRGTAPDDARRELLAISNGQAQEFPDANEGWSYDLDMLSDAFFESVQAPVAVLAAGAILVLLLVCVNLTNLILIRSQGRAREWAMRRALGAGRGRLIRQMVTESLVLSVAGGLAGVALGAVVLDVLAASDSVRLPTFVEIGLDPLLATVAVGLSVIAGVGFGLIPSLGLGRRGTVDSDSALRDTRGASPGRASGRARRLLVLSQVGLAFVLLVGAGLMLESFRTLRQTDYGFDHRDLLLVQTDLRGEQYVEDVPVRTTAHDLLERARALPGVASAFLWAPNRLGYGNWVAILTREGRYELFPDERTEASRHALLPGTLEEVGIRLVAGRDFGPQDGPDGSRTVIVSESFAAAFWPGEDAVGRRVEGLFSGELESFEVVGVVQDARHRTRLIDPFGPQLDVYFPFDAFPSRFLTLALRMEERADPGALVGAVRSAVREVDPNLPLYDVVTMEARMREEESTARVAATLVGLYAALAMALAALGVYGVLSHAVRDRRREIGVRIALGARIRGVVGDVVGGGMRLVAAGGVLGLAGALATSRFIESALYGVEAWSLPVFVVVGAVLGGVALLACLVPAWRAARVDPVQALRTE